LLYDEVRVVADALRADGRCIRLAPFGKRILRDGLRNGEPALENLLVLVCGVDSLEFVEEPVDYVSFGKHLDVVERFVEARERAMDRVCCLVVDVPSCVEIVSLALPEERASGDEKEPETVLGLLVVRKAAQELFLRDDAAEGFHV